VLRLPILEVETPASLADALAILASGDARIVAGGTDLLPNLKHRIERPTRLISVLRLPELRRIALEGDALSIGAAVTLAELSADARVRELFPSLAEAAGIVAGPQIRNQATLGGNVNLDTRCRYINQTDFWRGAIGGCLKSEGDVCHVVPGGQKCVAAMSSDCVPVLISLDARIRLSSSSGDRDLDLCDYYHSDGIRHTKLLPQEITRELLVPLPRSARKTAYVKWRPRGSIDFPLVSVALRFDFDEMPRIAEVRVVAGVLGARPRVLEDLEDVKGKEISDPAVSELVARAVHRQVRPLANVPYDAAYRRDLYEVLTARAIRRLSLAT
jgi:4-hydroxybenzoyl-CoA reductase subunit beta